MSTFIAYACPIGALARQLDEYLEESRRLFGPNKAHAYPPHCTLTGFFQDQPQSVDIYRKALDAALRRLRPERPEPAVVIARLRLENGFHRIALASPWLRRVTAEFARLARSDTRDGELDPKIDLHLSLAYYGDLRPFPEHMQDELSALAKSMLDLRQQVTWEVRLYERRRQVDWLIHGAWPLD